MSGSWRKLSGFLAAGLLGLWLVGCENKYPESIYDPNFQGAPAPRITSVLPQDSALAGIGEIVIRGENFSPEPSKNFVFFGKVQAQVIRATPTELTVKTPNVIGDSIQVKVAVHGALLFSNAVRYRLVQAIWDWGGFLAADDPWAITCDAAENLYVSLTTRVVDKVAPDGRRQSYGTLPFIKATGMKMGPEGYLYVARGTKTIYRIPPGGGAAVKWIDAPDRINDFDFAPSKSMYAGGDGNSLYLIRQDGSASEAASYRKVNIRTVRVFQGYVYVGGQDSLGQSFVWRNQILDGDQLGPKEVYFEWNAQVDPSSRVYAITFAQDGDMYVGTDNPYGIIVVHPDRTFAPLYEGLIKSYVYSLAWGKGVYLYANQRNDSDPSQKRMLRINTLKVGAPYYGRE
ncbi:MAG: IPT/TIG domain-containing protein [candidate division KSB1 bacterium]|nr:IPT/TIG domain-containing protein [candidate division KSB1 bacterium]